MSTFIPKLGVPIAGRETVNVEWRKFFESLQIVDVTAPITSPVLSVNSIRPDANGNVRLTYADIGAEKAGTAQTLINSLRAEADPFPQYLLDSDVVTYWATDSGSKIASTRPDGILDSSLTLASFNTIKVGRTLYIPEDMNVLTSGDVDILGDVDLVGDWTDVN